VKASKDSDWQLLNVAHLKSTWASLADALLQASGLPGEGGGGGRSGAPVPGLNLKRGAERRVPGGDWRESNSYADHQASPGPPN